MKGLAAVTSFRYKVKDMLFVSNFWDGRDLEVSSHLYELQHDSTSYYMQHLQEIPTQGARDCEHLTLPNAESDMDIVILAVASFLDDVVLYSLLNNTHSPIETTSRLTVRLGVTSPTALTSFHIRERLILVVACFSSGQDTAPSALYEVLPNPQPAWVEIKGPEMSVARRAEVHTRGAVDAVVFFAWSGQGLKDKGVRSPYVFFAAMSDEPSPLYRVIEDPMSLALKLELVQSVPCSGATNAIAFDAGAPYLAVAQPGGAQAGPPIIFRWNGTALLSEINSDILPKDSAGGQTLVGPGDVQALAVLPFHGSTRLQLLLGANNAGKQGSLEPAVSSIYLGDHEHVTGMRSPCALVATPDGKALFVASSGSRSIVAFSRNATCQQAYHLPTNCGMLQFLPEAGYLSNFTLRGLDRNDVSDRDDMRIGEGLAREQLGYPVRGIAGMALSPDGLFLYTTSMVDNLVAAFQLNRTSYKLALVQVVSEALHETAFLSSAGGAYGLLGARSLAVSASGNSVYVAGWRGHSLSIWHRAASDGRLSFLHRLRQGERRPETFRDLPAEITLDHEGAPWLVGADISSAVNDGLSFFIEGRPYFALAFTNIKVAVGPSDSPDIVGIYRINPYSAGPLSEDQSAQSEPVMTLVQSIPGRASSIEFFSTGSGHSMYEDYYLLVGSGLASSFGGTSGGQVSLLQWNRNGSRFDFHHRLPLPVDVHGQPLPRLFAQSIHAFVTPSGRTLVAVAFKSTGSDVAAASCLYRWDDRLPRPRSADGTVMLPYLELLHTTPASGAIDVESIFVEARTSILPPHTELDTSGDGCVTSEEVDIVLDLAKIPGLRPCGCM